ncbi:hypothetical protein CW709_05350 [Candidatus Bathyarchaeota archaeon]|nr:MAG: hypothetical protein CW709_05350 [Candidatus Bathyarchaeota archaeon]
MRPIKRSVYEKKKGKRKMVLDAHTEHKEEIEGCRTCRVEESLPPFWKDKRILLIAVSASFLSIGLILKLIFKLNLPAEALFVATAITVGFDIAKEGLSSLIFFEEG